MTDKWKVLQPGTLAVAESKGLNTSRLGPQSSYGIAEKHDIANMKF